MVDEKTSDCQNNIDRRHAYRQFNREQIEEFLDGRKIISIELLTSGKSNSNYKIQLEDKCIVVRLFSQGDAARENYIISLVKDIVPTPVELYRGDRLAVYDYIQGEHLSLHPDHTYEAASVLARIFSISFENCGWIDSIGRIKKQNFGDYDSFYDMMLDNKKVISLLGQQTTDTLKKIITSKTEQEDQYTARLVHGDFNPTNILIQDSKVSAVLDWEYSHSNTIYMDIGNMLRHTPQKYVQDIYRGLTDGGIRLPEDWQRRAAYTDLGAHLEFLTSNRSHSFKQETIARIHTFIRQFS